MSGNLRFGRFEWQPMQRRLLADGQPLRLGSRAFDILSLLITQRDRVVAKDEILRDVWRGRIVEDNNLTVQIAGLRKLVGDGAIATVAGSGYRWVQPVHDASQRPATALREAASIAVLPFALADGRADQEYFADGLAEDLAAGLLRSSWLRVSPHTATLVLRGSRDEARVLGERLGVDYLVRGSLRVAGGAMRLAVEMIDCARSQTVWAERYERPLGDLFAVQDDIVARLVSTIEPALLKHEESRARAAAPEDLQHWELLMRARWHYWRSSQRHNAESLRLLRLALSRRPDDVQTLALLAFGLATEVWSGWAADPKATALEAKRLAVRAVSLDERDAFAHFTLGVAVLGFGELDRAIAEQRRAVELHPHFAAAAAELGRLLAFRGETGEARLLLRRAIDACPTEPRMSLWMFGLAIADFVDGRPAEAARLARAAIAHRPDWFFNHYLLAACLECAGDRPGAEQALAEGRRLQPAFDLAALRVGHPFARDDDRRRYVEALCSAGWKPGDVP